MRLPLLQGITFTAVSPMIAIGLAAGGGTAGLVSIYGSVMCAGLFTFLVAAVFRAPGQVLCAGGRTPPRRAAAGLVEIAKIANYRFDELVANANPIASAHPLSFSALAPH